MCDAPIDSELLVESGQHINQRVRRHRTGSCPKCRRSTVVESEAFKSAMSFSRSVLRRRRPGRRRSSLDSEAFRSFNSFSTSDLIVEVLSVEPTPPTDAARRRALRPVARLVVLDPLRQVRQLRIGQLHAVRRVALQTLLDRGREIGTRNALRSRVVGQALAARLDRAHQLIARHTEQLCNGRHRLLHAGPEVVLVRTAECCRAGSDRRNVHTAQLLVMGSGHYFGRSARRRKRSRDVLKRRSTVRQPNGRDGAQQTPADRTATSQTPAFSARSPHFAALLMAGVVGPRLRVGLHVSQLIHTIPGGIGRVTQLLCDELPKYVDVVPFAVGSRCDRAMLETRLAPRTELHRVLGVPSIRWQYELWRHFRRPRVHLNIDVCHAPSLALPPTSAALVVSVNDVAFLHHPETFTTHGLRFHARGLATARAAKPPRSSFLPSSPGTNSSARGSNGAGSTACHLRFSQCLSSRQRGDPTPCR